MDASKTSDKGYAREDWQKHYETGDLGWDLGEVAPPFVQLWKNKTIVPGTMLVPGCGRGHEVLFLSEKGFQVTAVDFAAGAVDMLTRSLQARGLRAEVLHEDFFRLDEGHNQRYDLMLEQTFFCAIHPSRRSEYVETATRILKPNGLLAGLFYETSEEGGPPYNTTEADILHHFSSMFTLERLEKTPLSVDKRKGKEWLGLLRKK